VRSLDDLTLLVARRKQGGLVDVAVRFRDATAAKALERMASQGPGTAFKALCDGAKAKAKDGGRGPLAKWARSGAAAVLRCPATDGATGAPLVLQGAGSSKGGKLVLVQRTGLPNQQWCWHDKTQRLAPAHCAASSDDEGSDGSSSSSGGSGSSDDSDGSGSGSGGRHGHAEGKKKKKGKKGAKAAGASFEGASHSLVVGVEGARGVPGARAVLARPQTASGQSARSSRGNEKASAGQRWCLDAAGRLANGLGDGQLALGVPEGEHLAEGTELVLVDKQSERCLHWSLDFDQHL
jgi:hypothetical protein